MSPDGNHHTIDGCPMYAARFDLVRAYHEPGLAPAHDSTGAFHINTSGSPAYSRRYREAWGFYEGLAAAAVGERWTHITEDGVPRYPDFYSWSGNFQEGRCTVRGDDGLYRHIDLDGRLINASGHLYAGDFRERAAVVRYADDGLCGHVGPDGTALHGRRFIDLDVFHKGLARARDARGWFHIARDGKDAYRTRFAEVEPFYNGTAFAHTLSGDRVLIKPDGAVTHMILEGRRLSE